MNSDSNTNSSEKASKKSRLLRDAEEYRQNLDKRGIIYLTRIPPLMKPNKIRVLLQDYGKITRIYLAEEGISIPIELERSAYADDMISRCRNKEEAERKWWKRFADV
jgi:hypothetical protein